MAEIQLGVVEARYADMIWEHLEAWNRYNEI